MEKNLLKSAIEWADAVNVLIEEHMEDEKR